MMSEPPRTGFIIYRSNHICFVKMEPGASVSSSYYERMVTTIVGCAELQLGKWGTTAIRLVLSHV